MPARAPGSAARAAGQEEIAAAAHGDELRQPARSARHAVARGRPNPSVGCPAGSGSRLPSSGSLSLDQAVELRARQPRVLDELELACDVGVQADEVQSGSPASRRIGQHRLLRWQASAVFAAAAQNSVKPAGGDQVVTQVIGRRQDRASGSPRERAPARRLACRRCVDWRDGHARRAGRRSPSGSAS